MRRCTAPSRHRSVPTLFATVVTACQSVHDPFKFVPLTSAAASLCCVSILWCAFPAAISFLFHRQRVSSTYAVRVLTILVLLSAAHPTIHSARHPASLNQRTPQRTEIKRQPTVDTHSSLDLSNLPRSLTFSASPTNNCHCTDRLRLPAARPANTRPFDRVCDYSTLSTVCDGDGVGVGVSVWQGRMNHPTRKKFSYARGC